MNAILLKSVQFDTTSPKPDLTVSGMSISQYPADMEGYYVVQFRGYIRDEWKRTLKETGASMFDYIPNNAFVIRMNASVKVSVESLDMVQWIGVYQPAYRISPVLQREGEGRKNITVLLFDASDSRKISEDIISLGGEIVESAGDRLRVRIDRSRISEIAFMNGVSWIELYAQPVIFNDIAANISGVYPARKTHGLNGSGQVVAVADTGLDTGFIETVHDDFKDRVAAIYPWWSEYGDFGAQDENGHGTHVAGSVLGNGSRSNGIYAGMAPDSRLVFQAMQYEGANPAWNGSLFIPTDLSSLFQEAYSDGAKIHSNSWGSDNASLFGDYTSESQHVDGFMWNNTDILIIFAAGNNGPFVNTVSPPATSKNSIAVGASENYRAGVPLPAYSDNIDEVAIFSSRGLTDDNRIKPDIVAPGTYIISSRSSRPPASYPWGVVDSYYAYSGGTSMATPMVAGTAALVRQYYVNNESISPSAALIKATLINGADNLSLSRDDQGWGRMNLTNSLFPSYPRTMRYHDITTGLGTSQSWNASYYVHSNSEPLRITLVWTDYKGNPAALNQLVNDLTLNVTAPSGSSYLGNGGDSMNNVERVEIPLPDVGSYDIRVEGTNIPQGPQPFAIVMSGAIVRYDIDSCTAISMPGTYKLIGNITDSTASNCIEITSNDVVFDGQGNTVDGLDTDASGVIVYNSTAAITNVTVKNSAVTDWKWGIRYIDASNSTIENNIVVSNLNDGIYIDSGSNNTLIRNKINSNTKGIYIQASAGNTLSENNMSANGYNFILYGTGDPHFDHNIDLSNTVDGKPVYYMIGNDSRTFNSSTSLGWFGCIRCNNITLKDLVLTNNSPGVLLWNTTNSNITNVTVRYNNDGIWLGRSAGNNLRDIIAGPNSANGIFLSSDSNDNTLINNTASSCVNGIYLSDSGNNNLIRNNASMNTNRGILIVTSNGNNLTDIIANSNDNGIMLVTSSNNTITNSIASNNTWDFYSLLGSINNTIINLTINPALSFTGKDIAVKSVSFPPSDPSGYRNLSRYINAINTSSDSWLLWNVSYDESEVTTLIESSLRIWRYSGSAWSQVSSSGVDTAQNRIFANITSFSIFAPLALPDTTPPAVTNLIVTPYTPEIGERVNITLNANDMNMNYTSVYVTVEHPGGYTNTLQMNGNVSYYYVYTNTSEYGRYNVTINASDAAGNFNNTEKTWFITIASYNSGIIRIYNDGNGTVANGSMTWNAANFPGLAHEETLNVLNVSGRTIPANGLWYNTSRKLVQYKMNIYKSIAVENAFDDSGIKQSSGGGWQYRIGWQGISNVAVNGTANRTATVIEHEWSKKILAAGEIWNLGDGYSLVAHAMDVSATPSLVWLSFKNDSLSDDRVINKTYNYSASGFAGESNVPIIASYVDTIYKGPTRDMVKLGYSWFIYNVTSITTGSSFGNLTVERSSADAINLTNQNNIDLVQNSTIHIIGDMYFNVTNSSSLEYYPYFPAPAHVDARSTADTTLDIVASTGVQGFINVTMMKDVSPDMNRSFGFIPFGKFVSIFPNMADDFRWMMIRIYYTENELTGSGLDESSLQIYRYNDSIYPEKWESLADGSPSWVFGTGVNTANTGAYSGYIWANVSRPGYFALGGLLSESPSSPSCNTCSGPGGGSGGGGGGGTSGENYSNIEVKEKRDMHIFKDKVSSYRFNTTDPILYINITGNISAGEVTTIVEVLRTNSSIVNNTPAPGIVYKNINIWVGTSGFATKKNIKQGTIIFRVRNSWLSENGLSGSDVRMMKWDGNNWIELETAVIEKDASNTYFEAKTSSFSPFAITGSRGKNVQSLDEVRMSEMSDETSTYAAVTKEKQPMNILLLPTIVLILTVVILAAVYVKEQRKK